MNISINYMEKIRVALMKSFVYCGLLCYELPKNKLDSYEYIIGIARKSDSCRTRLCVNAALLLHFPLVQF